MALNELPAAANIVIMFYNVLFHYQLKILTSHLTVLSVKL